MKKITKQELNEICISFCDKERHRAKVQFGTGADADIASKHSADVARITEDILTKVLERLDLLDT